MRLIQPIFLTQGNTYPLDGMGEENKAYALIDVHERIIRDIADGVTDFLIFPVPLAKEVDPNWGWQGDAINEIKNRYAYDSNLIVDVCLCSTMPDGHCKVTGDEEATRELLLQQALILDKAGADVLAPSDCQEHTVKDIRAALLGKKIMSYSTKFRSTFYSGYRKAVNVEKGIHRDYQLEVSDRQGAIERSIKYAKDGADYLMVKPGMTSIDLIHDIKKSVRDATHGIELPVGVFQTSGEWSALESTEQLKETYNIFKRAGADYMISYGARLL